MGKKTTQEAKSKIQSENSAEEQDRTCGRHESLDEFVEINFTIKNDKQIRQLPANSERA